MMKNHWLWYAILVIFIIGIIAFVIGFNNAVSIGVEVTQPVPVSPAETEPDVQPEIMPAGEYRVAVIGDSLAQGTGDPTGDGFVGRVVQEMELQFEEPVTLYNFAIEGLRSEDLVEQIENPLMIQGIAQARYIIVSIGGNNLRAIRNVPAGQQQQLFEEQLTLYLTHLDSIVNQIRNANEEGLIIFLGLYNLDYLGNDQENAFLIEWNYETHQLLETYQQTLFIPTYDLFQLNLDQYLSFDGVHPNGLGHEAIADRIIRNLFE
jgi:lysophospholipase L1-like esterase